MSDEKRVEGEIIAYAKICCPDDEGAFPLRAVNPLEAEDLSAEWVERLIHKIESEPIFPDPMPPDVKEETIALGGNEAIELAARTGARCERKAILKVLRQELRFIPQLIDVLERWGRDGSGPDGLKEDTEFLLSRAHVRGTGRSTCPTPEAAGRDEDKTKLAEENDLLKRCINDMAGGATQGYLAYAKFRNRVNKSAPPSGEEAAARKKRRRVFNAEDVSVPVMDEEPQK